MELLNEMMGFFSDIPLWTSIAGVVLVTVVLGYIGAPLWLWAIAGFSLLAGIDAPTWSWITYTALVLLFNIVPIRRALISNGLMKLLNALNFLPKISKTEQTAIEAGTVWMDGELFSGNPDFKKILEEKYPKLTDKERAFMEGPVEQLCNVVNDWDLWVEKALPDEAWDIIKEEKFFGLIIPEKYGGLNFSATAHSTIVGKLASRCGPLATTVMVPNSLGPAELLIHYGTEEQKDYYLPRLADAKEIPCFGLTEPRAGSDAGAMEASGELFKADDGELYIKLNFKKRYITLAAISTVIGLAFKMYDPDNLLGKGTSLGITCALIPSDNEGITLGRRHDPLGVPFYNCPINGEDVVVPASSIIGGIEQAGNGWRMLMESLAVGRGISLPAQAVGGAKLANRYIGAYTAIRRQFGLNIGKFEGIEEPMARIGGLTYLMEGARKFTTGGLDSGAKPAVVTAIAKYFFTELGRTIVNDAMDIAGGAGISRGPRNALAHSYIATPIAITVEGANILTRTLMIFGQGAIRCHPFAYSEIDSLMRSDLKDFDKAFWGHIGHIVNNMFRSIVLSVTRGKLASSPVSGPAKKYYKKLAWTSASFAFLSDLALGSYGGGLKRKEKISGRFADILGWMYLLTGSLRRFEEEGSLKDDQPFFEWSMQYGFAQIQQSFDGLLKELDVPGLSWLFSGPVALWSRINRIESMPSDKLGHQLAKAMQTPGKHRDQLTKDIFIKKEAGDALGQVEITLDLIAKASPAYGKIYKALKAKKLPKKPVFKLIDTAEEKGIISKSEAENLHKAEEARFEAVQVDEFTLEEYKHDTPKAPLKNGKYRDRDSHTSDSDHDPNLAKAKELAT